MKYQFKKNGQDDYSLVYGDKEIKFKSNVGIVEEIQNIIPKARMKMLLDLSKQGNTLNDLVIVKKEDGKTYYDNSNKDAMEKIYIEKEQEEVFTRIINETLGKPYEQLVVELDLITEKEVQQFGDIFGKCIMGQYEGSPSDDKAEENNK